MKRTVSAHLELDLHDSADLIFSIAVAQGAELESESFTISSANGELEARELIGRHGTRLHRLTGPAGKMTIDYAAVSIGQAKPAPVDELDLIEYRRPSRYCESDTLFSTAQAEFAGLHGQGAARRRHLLGDVAPLVRPRLERAHRRSRGDDAGP